jgi:Tol biopolymer transport system component
VAVGCGIGRGAVKSEAKRAISPCGTATAPTWSPDGTQIAWYGYRWPRPPHNHAVGSYNILRAVCVSDADGKHVHRLRNTVAASAAPSPLATRRIGSTGC